MELPPERRSLKISIAKKLSLDQMLTALRPESTYSINKIKLLYPCNRKKKNISEQSSNTYLKGVFRMKKLS